MSDLSCRYSSSNFSWSLFGLLSQMMLGIHFHSHLCQLCHECWVGTFKDCIGLCQSFQFVTMCLHPPCYSVQFTDRLMVPFWWGWRYAIYILYRCCVSPLSYGGDHSTLFLTILAEKDHEPRPCLEVSGLPYTLSNVFVGGWCLRQNSYTFGYHHRVEKRLPSCTSANSLSFSNWSIKQARGSAGLYGPIIFTAFSSRLVLFISLYELNKLWIIFRSVTCAKSVNWSTSGNKKTGCTSVAICFFSDPSTAVHLLKSDWLCQNRSVPSAWSWEVPNVVG